MTSLRDGVRTSFVGPIVICLFLVNGFNAAIGGIAGPIARVLKRLIEYVVRHAFGDVLLFSTDWSRPLNSLVIAVLALAMGALLFGVAWLLTMWLYVWGTHSSTEGPSA